ncbi:MAG TPA: putative glycolipid-binding domain-containing protein [Actinomycetota bacterium]|nr:putative glycolipid-binding domain-containing protein [Actinomycetota bacterium]
MLWNDRRTSGAELCVFESAGAPRFTGTVVVAFERVPHEIRYELIADADWHTRRAEIIVRSPHTTRVLSLTADGRGAWKREGRPVHELSGCLDIDLGVTPSTNTLAIRRLGLQKGQAKDLYAAWVGFPNLELQKLEQRYEKVDDNLFRYSSPGFSALLSVDEHGVVLDYEGLWQAVAAARL